MSGSVAARLAQIWHALGRVHHHGWATHTDAYAFVEAARAGGLEAAAATANASLDAAEAALEEEGGEAWLGLHASRTHVTASGRGSWTVTDDHVLFELRRPGGRALAVWIYVDAAGDASVASVHGIEVGPERLEERHLAYVVEVFAGLLGPVSAYSVSDVIRAAADAAIEARDRGAS